MIGKFAGSSFKVISWLESEEFTFSFECIQCGKCCINNVINLFTHDIVRLKRKLKKQTTDLIREGIFVIDYDRFGFPIAFLNFTRKPNGLYKCPFLEWRENKYWCKIYDARPFVCRMFPINLSLLDRNPVFIYYQGKCPGTGVGENQTIRGYITANNLDEEITYVIEFLKLVDLYHMNARRFNERNLSTYIKDLLYDFDSTPNAFEIKDSDPLAFSENMLSRVRKLLEENLYGQE